MYEFHGTQQGTNIHPGQTFDLDYSVTQTFPLEQDLRLQLGLAGYGQWQTTDKNGANRYNPHKRQHTTELTPLGFCGETSFCAG